MAQAQLHHSRARLILQDEFAQRMGHNARYSLRAFARSLGVDPSLLSKVITGKRSLSRNLILQCSEKLGFSPAQSLEWLKMVEPGRKRATTPVKFAAEYQVLSEDHFRLISDWYHYAIFELVRTRNFTPSYSWVAETLGISVVEASVAVKRLKRLGLLDTSEKPWKRLQPGISILPKGSTTQALRKLQKQVLNKAMSAVDEVPLLERDNTSMTMAIDSSLLPQAREMITRFRRQLCRKLQSTGQFDSVYQLGVALFPLNRGRK